MEVPAAPENPNLEYELIPGEMDLDAPLANTTS